MHARASHLEIIAHRGYSARAPENTIVALERAIEAGAVAVEFDLHTTADGVPVLLHDETLDRTTDGTGPIARLRAGALDHLDAGGWFGPDFAGEPLPTLEAALEAIGARVHTVFAELKGVADPAHVEEIVSIVQKAGMMGRTVFISMDWALLDAVRRFDPEAKLGPIVEHPDRIPAALRRARSDARTLLDFDARILLDRPEVAREAVAEGIELAVWTVDDPADATRLLELGVRRITSNEVTRLLDWAATAG